MLVNFDDSVDAGLDVVWAGILEVENVHRVASTFDAQNGCASLLARFFTLLAKKKFHMYGHENILACFSSLQK